MPSNACLGGLGILLACALENLKHFCPQSVPVHDKRDLLMDQSSPANTLEATVKASQAAGNPA